MVLPFTAVDKEEAGTTPAELWLLEVVGELSFGSNSTGIMCITAFSLHKDMLAPNSAENSGGFLNLLAAARHIFKHDAASSEARPTHANPGDGIAPLK